MNLCTILSPYCEKKKTILCVDYLFIVVAIFLGTLIYFTHFIFKEINQNRKRKHINNRFLVI